MTHAQLKEHLIISLILITAMISKAGWLSPKVSNVFSLMRGKTMTELDFYFLTLLIQRNLGDL
jgi:hypothetical protein